MGGVGSKKRKGPKDLLVPHDVSPPSVVAFGDFSHFTANKDKVYSLLASAIDPGVFLLC